MYRVGQKVICVDDHFHPSIVEWCEEIPVTGEIYTIRKVTAGTCPANRIQGPGFHFQELDNLIKDTGQETCFADWRFNPCDEYPDVIDDSLDVPVDDLRPRLRESNFLIWLQRFVGEWTGNDTHAVIRRREDGWLEASSLEPGSDRRVIKTSSLPIKPMTVEEAALKLEGSSNDFVVFKDSGNLQVSVLYKRRDANFGLISAEA